MSQVVERLASFWLAEFAPNSATSGFVVVAVVRGEAADTAPLLAEFD